MQTNLLIYIQTILERVSFDAHLFEKELLKSLKMLNRQEIRALRKWCVAQFGQLYGQLIRRVFRLRLRPSVA
jgi:hypothetical protein